uniref:Rpl2 n=1 Tax=Oxytricha trifallax TaxID=1172189 RepID=G9HRG3_9SPIT|nr:rpl2 [Oxytricha trifallax]
MNYKIKKQSWAILKRYCYFTNSNLAIIKKKNFKINYSLRIKYLGTVAAFSLIPFKNKLLSLVFFSNGFISYFLSNDRHVLFSFLCSKFEKNLRKINLSSTHFMLLQIKKLSFVSCVEIIPGLGAQYIRSPGTKGRIISFEKTTHSCLIKLPSGLKKIFSYYSFAFMDSISLQFHKKRKNGKAGFWRTFGRKSMVRGVAMNAVDHPHGGRTKSIKTPLTPWGKITKRK